MPRVRHGAGFLTFFHAKEKLDMWHQEPFIVVSHWKNNTAVSNKWLLPVRLIAGVEQSGVAEPATLIHLTYPLPWASRQLAVTETIDNIARQLGVPVSFLEG